jgi:hypothetical protein
MVIAVACVEKHTCVNLATTPKVLNEMLSKMGNLKPADTAVQRIRQLDLASNQDTGEAGAYVGA